MRILTFLLLLILGSTGSPVAAQSTPTSPTPSPRVTATYRPVRLEDGKTKAVQFIWVANFDATSPLLQGTVKMDSGSLTLTPTITSEFVRSPVHTIFTALVKLDQNVIDNAKEDIEVTLSAAPAQTAPVATSLTVNLEGIKDYFSKLAQIDDLGSKLEETPQPPVPAKLDSKEVISVTDRTIKVRLQANQSISVDVFAYQTSEESEADGKTPFKKLDQFLNKDEPREITIEALTENKPYILRIMEIRQKGYPKKRVLLNDALRVGPGSAALHTLETSKIPTATIKGLPRQKRNDAIHVQINATNATSVRASAVAFNSRGEEYQVSKEVQIPFKNDPSDQTLYEGDIPVTLGIKEGVEYRVDFRAVNDKTILESAIVHSDKFPGLSPKLFEVVELEIGASTLKFTPTKASSKIKTEVTITVNDQDLKVPCKASSPGCDIDVKALLALLQPQPTSGGSTGTAKAPSASKLTFVVTVTDAETERTQSSTFALSVAAPDPNAKNGKQQLQNFQSFAKNVISNDHKDDAVLSGNQKGTGIAGFFGALLRGFLRI